MVFDWKRRTWRKVGFAIFIPLGVVLAADWFSRGHELRAAAMIVQVFAACLALPYAGLVRWPFSERSRIGSGIAAMAIFMVGKFVEWHLRSGLTYAVVFTAILLTLATTMWWLNRELRRESSHP